MVDKNASKTTNAPKTEDTTKPDGLAANRAVMAARLKTAQDTGVLTPKMQRGFDAMASYILKGEQ